jgi:hypothetical protein
MHTLPARKASKISQKVKRQWRMPPTKRGAMKAESAVRKAISAAAKASGDSRRAWS